MTIRVDDDLLDAALEQLLLGKPAADVLASYPAAQVALGPLLCGAAQLVALRAVPLPAADSLVADRNDFLAQVTELQLLPVSDSPLARLKGWISQRIPWPVATAEEPQKEARNMFALILKFGLVLTILAGSLGGTLATAAVSLPDSAVYPIKLAMEQAQLTLRNDPAGQAEQHLAMAQERVQEMVRLAAKGEAPEEALMVRMQNHMRNAYQSTAQVEGGQMAVLLAQARTMTQNSEQQLAAAQEHAQERVQQRLGDARGSMFRWQHEAEAGLDDPATFRHQYGPGGPCGDETCEPPYGEGEGNSDSGQNQYGPGSPCEGEECEPPYSEGEGDGEQHQYGPGGPCQGEECEPPYGEGKGEGNSDSDQHQYGPGGPCQGEDCKPPSGEGEGNNDSDQHQYGPGGPCEDEECEPPSGSNNQEQNQEQNQGQGTTQNQNQEQNSGQAGGSDNSGGDNSGGSGGSGNSGGSDGAGGSEGGSSNGDSGGSSGGRGNG